MGKCSICIINRKYPNIGYKYSYPTSHPAYNYPSTNREKPFGISTASQSVLASYIPAYKL